MIAPSDDRSHGCVYDDTQFSAPLESLYSLWALAYGFRKLRTPILAPALFWLGSLLCLSIGLTSIVGLGLGWHLFLAPAFWTAIALMTLGPLVLRIVGELVDVVFRIHDHVVLIAMRRR